MPKPIRSQILSFGSLAVVGLSIGSVVSASGTDPQPSAPRVGTQNGPESSLSRRGDQLAEVIVTATRQREEISRVPVSVQAITREQMDNAGVKEFQDVIRLSPGLTFNTAFAGGSNIAIRGIGSNAGSATTGIYIDDVPIQVRNLGYSATSIFPRIFDLDRIEVLRGPQGTLFGSGSEGGTVRFILPEPSLTTFDATTRAEFANTKGGTPSYELGAAAGGPIVDNIVGFRASAYYRHDGGYIDRVTAPSIDIIDPTGSLYGPSAKLNITGTAYPHTNYENSQTYRLALKIAPTDTVSITPSYLYQEQRQHDVVDAFWLSGSNPNADRFAAPLFSQISGFLNATGAPDFNAGKSQLSLPSVEFKWQPAGVALYSTTSYMTTRKYQFVDSTVNYLQSYNGTVYPSPGYKAPDRNVDQSQIFTQELRIQSDIPDSRLSWLVGAFYSHAKQYSQEDIHPNFFDTIPSYFGIPNLDNGPPFGPGSTNFQNIWGSPLLPNSTSYYAAFTSIDKQSAAFAQISFKPIEKLTLTAGVRVSKNSFNFAATFAGPENNLNSPFGSPCPAGQTCIFNDPNGYWAPQFAVGSEGTSETAVTPKYTVSYQADPSNLYYATISKGFRPGGGELPLPSVCDAQLIKMGYVGPDGKAAAPLTYKSDNVWNYEVGSKNQVFDNKLSIDANAYVIKWTNVQTQINVPVCGYSFTDNFGSATSKGMDLAVQLRLVESLTLGLNASYNQAEFDKPIESGTIVIFRKGETLPQAGAPWTTTLLADYRQDAFGHTFYVHADYSFSSRSRPTSTEEPGTVNYQPLLKPDPKIHQVDLRLGTNIGRLDASLFVNNLFDSTPLLAFGQPQDINGIGSAAVWTASTLRPRTLGITLSTRF